MLPRKCKKIVTEQKSCAVTVFGGNRPIKIHDETYMDAYSVQAMRQNHARDGICAISTLSGALICQNVVEIALIIYTQKCIVNKKK